MRFAQFIVVFTLQMQVLGIFQTRLAKKFVSHRSGGSREISRPDPIRGSSIGYQRSAVMLGNATQENVKERLRISLQGNVKNTSNPAVNSAHRPSSTNAKGLWNQFMFRGKSDFRYVLSVDVRQEKCRALTFSQVLSSEFKC